MDDLNLSCIGGYTRRKFSSREIWKTGICSQSELQSMLNRKVDKQRFFLESVRKYNDDYERRKFTFKQVMLIYIYQIYLQPFHIRIKLLKAMQ